MEDVRSGKFHPEGSPGGGVLFSRGFSTHAKENAIGRIVAEYAHARHLLIEGTHVVHLGSPFFICELSHRF